MNKIEEERLEFLLKTKPFKTGNSLDIAEIFPIDEVYQVQIDSRANYFDISFIKNEEKIEQWMFYSSVTTDINYRHRAERGRFCRSVFIEEIMENHPAIFEWILWHQELFDIPEKNDI